MLPSTSKLVLSNQWYAQCKMGIISIRSYFTQRLYKSRWCFLNTTLKIIVSCIIMSVLFSSQDNWDIPKWQHLADEWCKIISTMISFQHFIITNFKHKAKFKGLYNGYPSIHNLDFTVYTIIVLSLSISYLFLYTFVIILYIRSLDFFILHICYFASFDLYLPISSPDTRPSPLFHFLSPPLFYFLSPHIWLYTNGIGHLGDFIQLTSPSPGGYERKV